MKRILSGDEAIARGAWEAGCTVAAAYPGTPSTEILENISRYSEIYSEWSPNEKVAVEVASGAAIAGARTITSMKHVGLNVAADPLFTMGYEGINGGLVIVTADDPGMHSSQNEQDNRNYARAAKIPMLEPSDSQEAKDFTVEAFKISEEFDTPVLLRITTRIAHSKSIVELGPRTEAGVKPYVRNQKKYVMIPANARERHMEVEERLKKLKEYSNECRFNRIEWSSKDAMVSLERIGIITNGVSYQYAKEVFGDGVSYLKIGMSYPVPDKLIIEFAKSVEKIYIIEENDPYLETEVKALGISCKGKELIPACGELNPDIIRKAIQGGDEKKLYSVDVKVPGRPPVLCPGCPHRGIFYAISKYKDIIATGDIGCYTLGMMPPLKVSDTVICMGASISAGIGIQKASMMAGRESKVFAIIGDSTFFHSGITGLIDSVYNDSPIVVCILDNRITAMTGHQDNPGTGRNAMGNPAPMIDIESIVKAVGIKNVRTVDPYNLKETEDAVRQAHDSKEPFVIITKQPCALIKEVQKKRANMYCSIDYEKCRKCKACLNTGCPAIFFRNGKVGIDRDMCNGCTLCSQVCRFDAVKKAGDIE